MQIVQGGEQGFHKPSTAPAVWSHWPLTEWKSQQLAWRELLRYRPRNRLSMQDVKVTGSNRENRAELKLRSHL